ncbi:hypothetical protein DFJ74DRAFT_713317 [Hyaloraphidium curvatum]|nr:hypothetical protein DFJ74DRAFT_713317 [Hyaloraphidium curvatum]
MSVLLLAVAFRYLATFCLDAACHLGGTIWSSAWAAAGVLWVLVRLQNELPSICGGAGFTDNVAARELERRLTVRAVRNSLEALVGRLRDTAAGTAAEDDLPDRETWYATLVPLLATRWRQDAILPQMAALAAVFYGIEAVAIVVYVTTGNCIPAYTLAHQPLARRIAAHGRVLRDLEEVHVEDAGVRLFGARVTGSLARKVAAAALTAVFAAWTVLRALGVVLTMDMVCPASS